MNQQSLQKLFVGILLSLLTSMAIGLPIVMTVIAQQTQGETIAETVSDENTSELESQSQAPHNSGQTNCDDPEDISRTNRSMMLNVLPPEITMIYKGSEYEGELSESNYREGETISELQPSPTNNTANLPSNIVNLNKDSCVQFVITGTPRTLPPNSLDVSAYTLDNTPVAVLDAAENYTSTFQIMLDDGIYVLLSAATWDPTSADEDVGGYVIYNFLVNVTSKPST
ncbi:MAG: hypothetical protein GEU26_07080 [Nitrososphaeraceae archaeon]|nr:hypothetical protein [Nitrososphaeraceae archaeon]